MSPYIISLSYYVFHHHQSSVLLQSEVVSTIAGTYAEVCSCHILFPKTQLAPLYPSKQASGSKQFSLANFDSRVGIVVGYFVLQSNPVQGLQQSRWLYP